MPGRKGGLIFNDFVGVAGAALMALSQLSSSFEMLIIGRLVIGYNCGTSPSPGLLVYLPCLPSILSCWLSPILSPCLSLVSRLLYHFLSLDSLSLVSAVSLSPVSFR